MCFIYMPTVVRIFRGATGGAFSRSAYVADCGRAVCVGSCNSFQVNEFDALASTYIFFDTPSIGSPNPHVSTTAFL